MIVGHVGHVTPLPAEVWLSGAIVAGLLAAVVMNFPMSQRPTGYVPATIVAALIQQTMPSQVPFRDAIIVHHAIGPLVGAVYALAGLGLDAIVPAVVRVAGLSMAAHLLASIGVGCLLYMAFAWVLLPRYGGAARDELPTVRRDWFLSTVTFGLVLALAVPAITVLVR